MCVFLSLSLKHWACSVVKHHHGKDTHFNYAIILRKTVSRITRQCNAPQCDWRYTIVEMHSLNRVQSNFSVFSKFQRICHEEYFITHSKKVGGYRVIRIVHTTHTIRNSVIKMCTTPTHSNYCRIGFAMSHDRMKDFNEIISNLKRTPTVKNNLN